MNGPLRIIFAVAVLAMWVHFGYALAHDAWPPVLWAVLLAAHAVCAIVFYNFAYVFSYGYAISVLVCNLIVVLSRPSAAALLVGGACALYGLRLWGFVHARHRESSFRANSDRADAVHRRTPLGLKLAMWIMVSWLMAYHAMTSWNVAQHGRLTPWLLVGMLVMLGGLALEAVADSQKLAAKRRAPERWVSEGLYGRVRHPNYLGEIVFQVGLICAGIGSAASLPALLAALLAPGYIAVLMYYASEQLESRQQERYGSDAAYALYVARSGRLLPGSGAFTRAGRSPEPR